MMAIGFAWDVAQFLGGVTVGTTQTAKDIALVATIRAGGMKFSPTMARIWMEQVQRSLSMSDAKQIADELWMSAKKWIDSYGVTNERDARYMAFKNDWTVLRNCVTLQARLVVEQILYRKVWGRGLVGAFKPL